MVRTLLLVGRSNWLSAIALAVAAAGCGGATRSPIEAADASADDAPDDAPPLPVDVAAESSDATGGLPPFVWSEAPPPALGDGRLVDVAGDTQGFGWDTCDALPPLGLTPRETMPSPPPTRGDRYLLSSASPKPDARATQHVAQVYLWPERPGTAEGLWFDLALVSGSAEGSTITFYETDEVCVARRTFGTFSLATALSSQGRWKTGCIDLGGQGEVRAVGVRIDAYRGVVGFDALRFGEPCH